MTTTNEKDERLPKGVYRRDSRDGQARYYVRIVVEGQYQRFSPRGGFTDVKKAVAFLKHARADIERGKFFPEKFRHELTVPLAELLEEQTARKPNSPNTKNDRLYQAWWITHYGTHDARLLTPAHLEQAIHRLTAEQKSPQTIHHYMKFMRHRLALALRDDLIERSPFQKFTLPAVHNMRIRFYSHEERQRLYHALPPDWREAAELAALTGLRWSEQFRLTRDQIHLDEGFLALTITKSGRPQARLLNERAKGLMQKQLDRHRLPWLYPNMGGTGPIDHSYFMRYVWKPACAVAGVTNGRWNDWRHTFASDLTMAGHSDRTVAALMGHTSTTMVKRYAHLADAHLRQAVETVANQWPTDKQPTPKKP
jgi:site-specific recombinase XerD